MTNKKIKLVLSGSGTRYPCFVGAIQRLLEEGYIIEEICGTSGGSIIAAGFASRYNKEKPMEVIKYLEEMCHRTLPGPLLDINFFPFFRKGFYKGKKILKTLRKEYPKSFKELNIPLRVITFNNNLARKKIWTADDEQEVALTVRASMSLPGIFDLVKIEEDWHSDGGIVANFELDAFGTEEKNVFGITFAGIKKAQRREIFWKKDMIQSHIDGAIEEAMLEDIEDMDINIPVCYIKTDHGGLNLKMTVNDVIEQIYDGYYSMDERLNKK